MEEAKRERWVKVVALVGANGLEGSICADVTSTRAVIVTARTLQSSRTAYASERLLGAPFFLRKKIENAGPAATELDSKNGNFAANQ